MAVDVIMPALGMAQETGKLLRWLKTEGQPVTKGEPLMEIETDKVTVEIDASASGILANVVAAEGDEIPVGETMAIIVAAGEVRPDRPAPPVSPPAEAVAEPPPIREVAASPVAARIAAEHNLDLRLIEAHGDRIEKADVLAYLQARGEAGSTEERVLASPKARRLSSERSIDLKRIRGTGPDGSVLAADVLAATPPLAGGEPERLTLSSAWKVMAGRVAQSWVSAPHIYLLREVNAARLVAWREEIQAQSAGKITYTDLLVRLTASALRKHPGLNASWTEEQITFHEVINIGVAVAHEGGLVVPVIHGADEMSVTEIAARRRELVARAQAGKLQLEDVQGGTFTISNLGMYGVDAFSAILNPPQAAILAVGRIAEQAVALDGHLAVQPRMILSLSCDHRVVDGARGAQFLETLAQLIEEPLAILD